MRHLSALTVEATFDGSVPDLSRVPGVQLGRGRGQGRALPGAGERRAAVEGPRGVGRARAVEPRAVARGAVPRPLRSGRRGRANCPAMRAEVAPWSPARVGDAHREPSSHAGPAERPSAPGSCGATSSASRRVIGARLRLDLQDARRAGQPGGDLRVERRPRRHRRSRAPAPDRRRLHGVEVASPFSRVLGAVWGLLTGTRLLRGEEDAGRWELLLAGQTTPATGRRPGARRPRRRPGPPVRAITALITVVVGRSSKVHIGARRDGLLRARRSCRAPPMFLAVGALASQLAATRRQAAGYAGAALGVSYALRMVADSGTGLAWLRWATPLGWVEELQPLTVARPLASLPIVALTIAARRPRGPSRGHPRPRCKHTADHASAKSADPAPARADRPGDPLVRPASRRGWGFAIAAMALAARLRRQTSGERLTSTPSFEKVFQQARRTRQRRHRLPRRGLLDRRPCSSHSSRSARSPRPEPRKPTDASTTSSSVPSSRAAWLETNDCWSPSRRCLRGGLVAGVFTWIGAASEHAGVPSQPCSMPGSTRPARPVHPRHRRVHDRTLAACDASIATYGVLAWSFLVELVGGLRQPEPLVARHLALSPDGRRPAGQSGLDERRGARRCWGGRSLHWRHRVQTP